MHRHLFQPRVLAIVIATMFCRTAFAEDAELATITVKASAPVADAVHGSAASATKLDVPLRDVPQAVQVVPEELIREQGALEMKDVLRNVSGVSQAQGEGRRDQFYIRGFDATRDTLVDGMRDDNLYFRDLGNVERVEVVKGPAAVLYGRGSAGGVINRITKKPVAKTLREATITVGSYDLRRIDVDLGGAIAPQAAFRLTGAYETGDSYRDVVRSEREVLAPSISWSAGKDTVMLLQTEFLHQRRTPDRGIPSLSGAPADVAVGNFYGERYDYANTDARNARFSVEHAASDKLTLRNNFQYSTLSLDAMNTRTLGLASGNTQVRRQITYFPQNQTNYLNQTEAVYQFGSADVRHTLLAGVELGHQNADRIVRAVAASSVSLQAPQQIAPAPDISSLPVTINADFTGNTAAVYVQDQIALGQQWKVLAGLRFDRFKQQQDDKRTGTSQERTDSVWSPRVGVVYQPSRAHSLYGNLSRSFQPAGNDLFYNGSDLAQVKPLESLQKEVGVKSEWLGGRLTSTVGLYEITQRNIVTKDPSDPAGLRQIQVGEQQSRGWDVDLAGMVLPGWKIFANYSYNNARITQSNTFAVGNRPANIPKHSAGVWSSYDFGSGWVVGAGAFYVGERYAVEDNAVRLPAYTRLDAMIAYKTPRWEIGLNLNNLADRTYYEAANNNNQIQPGAPRNGMLYARMKM